MHFASFIPIFVPKNYLNVNSEKHTEKQKSSIKYKEESFAYYSMYQTVVELHQHFMETDCSKPNEDAD